MEDTYPALKGKPNEVKNIIGERFYEEGVKDLLLSKEEAAKNNIDFQPN